MNESSWKKEHILFVASFLRLVRGLTPLSMLSFAKLWELELFV